MYTIVYIELESGVEYTKSVTNYKELEYILEEIIGSSFIQLVSVRSEKKK